MSIFRSEQQVALQELYRLAQESVDHYRDSAEFVDDATTSQLFTRIANEREALAEKVAQAIRDTDDLPAAPDADRETGEQLIHRLHAWFTADQTHDVLAQRVRAEADLTEALAANTNETPGEIYHNLHQQLEAQVEDTRQLLRQAMSA